MSPGVASPLAALVEFSGVGLCPFGFTLGLHTRYWGKVRSIALQTNDYHCTSVSVPTWFTVFPVEPKGIPRNGVLPLLPPFPAPFFGGCAQALALGGSF